MKMKIRQENWITENDIALLNEMQKTISFINTVLNPRDSNTFELFDSKDESKLYQSIDAWENAIVEILSKYMVLSGNSMSGDIDFVASVNKDDIKQLILDSDNECWQDKNGDRWQRLVCRYIYEHFAVVSVQSFYPTIDNDYCPDERMLTLREIKSKCSYTTLYTRKEDYEPLMSQACKDAIMQDLDVYFETDNLQFVVRYFLEDGTELFEDELDKPEYKDVIIYKEFTHCRYWELAKELAHYGNDYLERNGSK